jgi:dihydroxyacetone kinase-like protein
MLPTSLTARDLRQILAFVAETIGREEAYLNSLDAAIGDGDHGITMRVGFNAVSCKVSSLPDDAGIDTVLREAGLAFMGATGGAIGVLLGRMFMTAGLALKGRQEIGPVDFRTLLGAMETALSSAGKAKPGDKTILDAVHGANQALITSGDLEQDLSATLTLAGDAAKRAAESTAQMLARIGRASRLGDRVLGHPDPGAVSFSIILRAMAEWLRGQAGSQG